MVKMNASGHELTTHDNNDGTYNLTLVTNDGMVYVKQRVNQLRKEVLTAFFEIDSVKTTDFDDAHRFMNDTVYDMWANFKHVKVNVDHDDDDWTVYSINGRELSLEEVDIYFEIVEEKEMIVF